MVAVVLFVHKYTREPGGTAAVIAQTLMAATSLGPTHLLPMESTGLPFEGTITL